MFRSKRQICMGNRTVSYGVISFCLLFFSSCYIQREPCPAYVNDAVPAGTYDYNGPYECSRWYEHRYGWIWSSDSKDDALYLWWEITQRPMYFEQDGEFRFTVRSDDQFEYNFFALIEGDSWQDTIGHMQYYITTDRARKYWDKVPL